MSAAIASSANSAAARSIAAEQHARHAITELDRRGQPVTFLAVAAKPASAPATLRPPQLRATSNRSATSNTAHRRGRPDIRGQTTSRSARGCGRAGGAQATPCRERAAAGRARTRTRRDPRAQARKPPAEHEMSEWPRRLASRRCTARPASSCSEPSRTPKRIRWRCSRSSWSHSGARAAAARTTRSRPTATTPTNSSCSPARQRQMQGQLLGPRPPPARRRRRCVRGLPVGGLSSGEGLIAQVRDPLDDKDTQAPADKRRLVVEPEFAQTLKVLARGQHTLGGRPKRGTASRCRRSSQ